MKARKRANSCPIVYERTPLVTQIVDKIGERRASGYRRSLHYAEDQGLEGVDNSTHTTQPCMAFNSRRWSKGPFENNPRWTKGKIVFRAKACYDESKKEKTMKTKTPIPHQKLIDIRMSHPSVQALSPKRQQIFRDILIEYKFKDNKLFHSEQRRSKVEMMEIPGDIAEREASWNNWLANFALEGFRKQLKIFPVLSAEDERALFLRYNLTRWHVSRIRKLILRRPMHMVMIEELLDWYDRSKELENAACVYNYGLVFAVIKRQFPRTPPGIGSELFATGLDRVRASVGGFDVGRGFKFSSYAWRGIKQAISLDLSKYNKYHNRIASDFNPHLEKGVIDASVEIQEDLDHMHFVLEHNSADLSDMEQRVIDMRFGFSTNDRPMTLMQVGAIFNLTKERVRQIQYKALEKLHAQF